MQKQNPRLMLSLICEV